MMRQGDLSKLAHIQVDISNTLDELWTLDIKKSSALPPAEVRENLEAIINRIADRSKRTWTFRGKKEISDTNNLVVDKYTIKDGLSAEIRSFAVFDYLKALLGTGKGADGYAIAADVLSAADFGAPQKRMRFAVAGIRKDIAEEVKLPQGRFINGPYRTVHDAIPDLEDVEPVFETADDIGIQLFRPESMQEWEYYIRLRRPSLY